MNAAERMVAIFGGSKSHHGVADFSAVTVESNGKRRPPYVTRNRAPTLADFEAHLNGGPALLIVPVEGDRCNFGQIDIDEYPVDLKSIAAKVARHKLPLTVERSKSGGAHLGRYYEFAKPAADVRGELAGYAATLGFGNVEIFPVQDAVAPGAHGNGIILPYRGGDRADNYAVDEHGERLSLAAWLDRVEKLRRAQAIAVSSVSLDHAAVVLADHWHSGNRHNLCIAALGTMLRNGIEEDTAQEIIDDVMARTGDEEAADSTARPRASVVARDLEAHKPMPGAPKLRELLGDSTDEFLRAIGAAKDQLPLTFPALPVEFLDQRPPALQFTVEGLLPRGVVALVIAEGGSGKTTFALRAALAVASGRPLFGLTVSPGRAVYVGLEDNQSSLWRRISSIWRREQERMVSEKLGPDSIAEIRSSLLERLIVESAVGKQLHLVRMFHDQAEQAKLIGQLIASIPRPVELLVLDPMARLHGAEENSNAVGTALINAAERIAREVECTVLIAHHTGKAAAKGRDESLYAARGASGFADAARSVLRLIVANADDVAGFSNVNAEVVARGDLVKLIHAKCNDASRCPDIWLRRQELDFDLWVPERSSSGGAERDLRALFAWWEREGRRPFTKANVEALRGPIFGPGTTVPRSREALAYGLQTGAVVESAEVAARAHHNRLTFREDFDPDAL